MLYDESSNDGTSCRLNEFVFLGVNLSAIVNRKLIVEFLGISLLLTLFVISNQLESAELKFALLTAIYVLFSCLLFGISRNKYIIMLSVFSAILYIPVVIFSNNATTMPVLIYQYSSLIFGFSLSCYLYSKPDLFYKVSNFNLSFFTLFLTVHYIISLQSGAPFYIYANDIFAGLSRNVVSFYAIFSMAAYLFSCKLYSQKIKYIRLFALVVFCVLLFGRSGIAISLAVLLLALFHGSLKKGFIIFIVISLFVLVFYHSLELSLMETNFSKGVESPRSSMNAEFLGMLDLKTLLFGVKLSDMPTVMLFEGNPHNSFISVNMKFGYILLFYIAMILFCLVVFAFFDLFYFILFTLLIFRYSLDTVAFFGQFTDLILYLHVIHAFNLVSKNTIIINKLSKRL
ncbi:hypothetical protein MD588_05375 [Photobacterium sp. SDRW27]|uniref:hypothetical protein n=1 Tax=Photobacterium obscurum TaxID=2829490 RepID=UPI0022447C2E|nr:hypothetical protein [Photobacterium obscurum]MCW8328234.1 hypothetical protein [Photobacterium obscurum]